MDGEPNDFALRGKAGRWPSGAWRHEERVRAKAGMSLRRLTRKRRARGITRREFFFGARSTVECRAPFKQGETMRTTLTTEATREAAARLGEANREFAARYPGESFRRQPVHT